MKLVLVILLIAFILWLIETWIAYRTALREEHKARRACGL